MIDRFVLIIGAMRCGTTSLYQYLAQHPEVAPCVDKEPSFFSNDTCWNKGLAWYQSLWSWRPGTHKVALEASTNYSKVSLFPYTADRIATIDAEFRFIYIMRNPIERIESHYTLAAAKGWGESARPLREGIHPDLIDLSRYAMQLNEYYKRFPRRNILLLNFDDLKCDAAKVMRRVCGFLDIDLSYEFKDLDVVHNSNMGRRPGELGHRLYRLRTWIPFWTQIAAAVTPRWRNAVQRILAREDASNVKLSAEQREFVVRALADDLRQLQTKLGFDISSWGLQAET